METFNLKSEKGGYNKEAVLTKITAFNVVLMALGEEQPDRDKILELLEQAEQMELPTEKTGFLGKSGFSVEDTDAYIARLEAEIKKLL